MYLILLSSSNSKNESLATVKDWAMKQWYVLMDLTMSYGLNSKIDALAYFTSHNFGVMRIDTVH